MITPSRGMPPGTTESYLRILHYLCKMRGQNGNAFPFYIYVFHRRSAFQHKDLWRDVDSVIEYLQILNPKPSPRDHHTSAGWWGKGVTFRPSTALPVLKTRHFRFSANGRQIAYYLIQNANMQKITTSAQTCATKGANSPCPRRRITPNMRP